MGGGEPNHTTPQNKTNQQNPEAHLPRVGWRRRGEEPPASGAAAEPGGGAPGAGGSPPAAPRHPAAPPRSPGSPAPRRRRLPSLKRVQTGTREGVNGIKRRMRGLGSRGFGFQHTPPGLQRRPRARVGRRGASRGGHPPPAACAPLPGPNPASQPPIPLPPSSCSPNTPKQAHSYAQNCLPGRALHGRDELPPSAGGV